MILLAIALVGFLLSEPYWKSFFPNKANFGSITVSFILWTLCVCFVLSLLGFVLVQFDRRNRIYQVEIKETENKIRKIEVLEKKTDIKFEDLIDLTIKKIGLMYELTRVSAKPRSETLYSLGVALLGVSLLFPIIGTIVYELTDPISDETIQKIATLKNNIGELPKEFNVSVSRDWHILFGGITFGFLCLAAARGMLAQQANEKKTYVEQGQSARYFEQLNGMVTLMLKQGTNKAELEKEVIRYLKDRMLINFLASKEDEKGSSEDEAPMEKVISAVTKASHSSH